MLIGLSLSMCVHDIMHGLVSIDSVTAVICGTDSRTDEEFNEVLRQYEITYWHSDGEGSAIAWELRRSGRLVQPRSNGLPAPNFNPNLPWIEQRYDGVELVARRGDAPHG